MDLVPGAYRPLVSAALAILCNARRPLSASELASALALSEPGTVGWNPILDFEYVLNHVLAGLVMTVSCDGQDFIHPGHAQWPPLIVDDCGITPSWLITGPEAHLRVALISIEYIKAWTGAVAEDAVVGKWPFLDYAVRFWHWHYLQAPDGRYGYYEELDIIAKSATDWDLIKHWLRLLSGRQPWRLIESELQHSSPLQPGEITELEIRPAKAVEVCLLAFQLLPTIRYDQTYDQYSARDFALWLLRTGKGHFGAQSFGRETRESLLLTGLTWSLSRIYSLLRGQDLGVDDLKAVLKSAIRQGSYSVANSCIERLGHVKILADELPWESCVRVGNSKLLGRLFSMWSQDSADRNQLGSKLLQQAMMTGQKETLEALVKCGFDINHIENPAQQHPLDHASRLGLSEVVRALLHAMTKAS